MSIWQSIILGIVEGITEFLPISSTGHLILASKIMEIPETDFIKTFGIVIQVGAIFAVLFLYWKKIFSKNIIKKVIVAFIPAGVIGLSFYSLIKKFLMGNEVVVLYSLAIVGLLLILFELRLKKTTVPVVANEDDGLDSISYKQSLLIGVAQSFAIIPGVSRSGATILGGLALGIDRKTVTEFSFILAVPTILLASIFELSLNINSFTPDQISSFVVGLLVSFVVAIFAIKFLINFIQKNTFIIFGFYRILVAVVFALFFLN